MKIPILGRHWKVTLVADEKFEAKFGADVAAVTLPTLREIIFCDGQVSLETVKHELVHAYYHDTCTSSADLTPDQVEEVFCDLFAIHGAAILKTAGVLYRELQK